MNVAETRVVVSMIHTLRPGQAYTFPAEGAERDAALTAWHLLLQNLTRDDAVAAVVKLAGDENRRFIEPQHILAEVRRVRARRVELEAHAAPAPAAIAADGTDVPVGRYRAELIATIAAIADGKAVNRVLAIEPGEPAKYVGKPGQWAGEAPVEHRPALDGVKEHLAAVRAERAPEIPRRLPPPLPADVVAAYDAARRILAAHPDTMEAYVEQARQQAKAGTPHVQIMIAAADIAQPQNRQAS